ncbi:MAG: iron-containing alcohol dehydrogenase [Candidatus Manganitrophaceae bacterium]
MVDSQAGVDKSASHAIGHSLSGTAGMPHGYTLCVMLPFVMKWNKPMIKARQVIISEALGRPNVLFF